MKPSKSHCECVYEKALKRHLLVKCAPVLLGRKPAVLLRLAHCRERYCETYRSCSERILKMLGLPSCVMYESATDIVVMFYDPQHLHHALNERPTRLILEKMGYDVTAPETALQTLSLRFAASGCPHEVGFFLGYPQKDVAAFMFCRERCEFVPKGQWRVFGNPAPSLHKMAEFRRAEAEIRDLCNRFERENINLDQWRDHLGNLSA